VSASYFRVAVRRAGLTLRGDEIPPFPERTADSPTAPLPGKAVIGQDGSGVAPPAAGRTGSGGGGQFFIRYGSSITSQSNINSAPPPGTKGNAGGPIVTSIEQGLVYAQPIPEAREDVLLAIACVCAGVGAALFARRGRRPAAPQT
jgi:hypothetical protein